jgi:two-component system LytT family response regulator
VRVLIVDDEPLARRGVVHRLRRFKDVEIVGECGDGISAVERILERSPDVVFLDIQMPGMDGFEVLRALPRESMPAVIFLTAYEQHVLRAFDVHALHYLLKPVDDLRFAAAVGRARDLVDSSSKADMAQRVMKLLDHPPDHYASRFTVQTGSRIQIVTAEEVEWIGAAGDYVEPQRPFVFDTRNDGFSRTEARPGEVSSHTPLPNCAVQRHIGIAIHREPRIYGKALGRLGAPLQPHLRGST